MHIEATDVCVNSAHIQITIPVLTHTYTHSTHSYCTYIHTYILTHIIVNNLSSEVCGSVSNSQTTIIDTTHYQQVAGIAGYNETTMLKY